MKSLQYWAILPAAGKAKRMGLETPKQYLSIHNKLVIEHALHSLLQFELLQKIVVVINSDDVIWQTLSISQHEKIITVKGGIERQHSVINGLLALEHLADRDDWILIHDAARPCLQKCDLDKLINALLDHPVGGLLGSLVKNTIKQVDSNHLVQKTIDRSTLWNALTPQMFRYGLLMQALESLEQKAILSTDESSAIELFGYTPVMVEGRSDNVKITVAEDLILAAAYLSQ